MEASLDLVLCALDEPLAQAWFEVAGSRAGVRMYQGSILDLDLQAVVSPANSQGVMRGGIDAVYARTFPDIEPTVRAAILATHGGELPVGEAVVVPTGVAVPAWLISAPTMGKPGDQLPPDTVHPYLAARAVLRLWRDGTLDDGTPLRQVVRSLGMPGLGTGVGGVTPRRCAHQVATAWDEVFGGP